MLRAPTPRRRAVPLACQATPPPAAHVPGEHAGVKPEAFNRALRFAFEPWMAAQKPE